MKQLSSHNVHHAEQNSDRSQRLGAFLKTTCHLYAGTVITTTVTVIASYYFPGGHRVTQHVLTQKHSEIPAGQRRAGSRSRPGGEGGGPARSLCPAG